MAIVFDEVIQTVNELHDQLLAVEEKPRRLGDPPELVAEEGLNPLAWNKDQKRCRE